MKDIILYHGSRGGIEGNIKLESREKCDFGKGFYLGENPMQVRGLICGDSAPVFYEIRLKLTEIPEERILDWREKTGYMQFWRTEKKRGF